VIRSRTARGFVPNFEAGGTKSVDRTEPQIGSKALLEIYTKYKDEWLVELLFDDLLGWSDWFVADRMLGPLGLVSLGSNTVDGFADYSPGNMQGARFESGLDNSPMYDVRARATHAFCSWLLLTHSAPHLRASSSTRASRPTAAC